MFLIEEGKATTKDPNISEILKSPPPLVEGRWVVFHKFLPIPFSDDIFLLLTRFYVF